MFKVLGVGEVLWDLFPEGMQFGGAPANFAFHAQALGAEGYMISAVGNDELGDGILDHLNSIGLDTDYIHVDNRYPTGTVEVKLDSNGKPDYIIHQNVAWDFIPVTERTLILARSADAVCFGSLAQRSEISRNSVRKILSTLKKDCLKVFDINLRQSFYSETIVRESLELCNCLKLNDDELPVVMDLCGISGNEVKAVKTLIREYELEIVALTKGHKGSLLVTENSTSFLEAPVVKIADTVGAGDAFTAALVMGLLHNDPIETIHRTANQLAAYVCTQNGATPVLPEELKSELSF